MKVPDSCLPSNRKVSKRALKRYGQFARDQNEKPLERYLWHCMGRLIHHQQYSQLELDGFLLQHGDRVEIRILGSWVPGQVAHDQYGWYFLTPEQVDDAA